MRALLHAWAVAALAACAPAEVSTTTTTAAEVGAPRTVAIDDAIAEITRAQCARTQACGAVASRGIYAGADYCDSDVRRATRDDLLGRCDWVGLSRLAACLDAVRREDCASMNATELAPDVCRSAWLCGP